METLTVIIPVFNGEDYIENAIESVLNQTFTEFTLIIVNDGSTDKTKDLVENYVRKDSRVNLINVNKIGLSAARNLGISKSHSEFISMLDCDDLWLPKKLERQIGFLKKNKNKVVFSQTATTDGVKISLNKINNDGVLPSKNNLLLHRYKIFGSASNVALSKEILDKCGGFNEKLSYGEDLDLWIRVSEHFEFHELPYADVIITNRPNSMQKDKNYGYFKNSRLYLYLWSSNNFRFDDKLDLCRARYLIWPEMRYLIFLKPLRFKYWYSELKKEFPDLLQTLYPNYKFLTLISRNCVTDALRIINLLSVKLKAGL